MPISPQVWSQSRSAAAAPLSGIVECDLAVIGGGVVGVTAAEQARRNGLDVCLLEARYIGDGASGRNAAGIAPIWGNATPDDVVRAFGEVRGRELNEALSASAAAILASARCYPENCSIVQGGFLMLAAKARTAASLTDVARQWQGAGAAVRPATLAELGDGPRYRGGLLFEEGGTLDPVAYVRALALAGMKAGLSVYEHTSVTRVARDRAGGWLVTTEYGAVHARTVALAVHGAGVGVGLDQVGWRIDCQLLASEPLSLEQRAAFPRCTTFADLDDPTVFGGTLDAAGRFVTTVMPGPRPLTLVEAGEVVADKLAGAFPAAADLSWAALDAGHIIVTADKLPQLLELGPGLFAAQGCNGYGLCAGTLLGEDLARLATGRTDMPARFPLRKPKRSPFARIAPAVIKAAMPIARRLF